MPSPARSTLVTLAPAFSEVVEFRHDRVYEAVWSSQLMMTAVSLALDRQIMLSQESPMGRHSRTKDRIPRS